MSPESSTMTFSFRPGFTCVCPNTGPGPPSLSEWMTSQPGSAASTEAATTEVLPMPSMPSPGVMTCALTRMCGTVHSGVTATRSLTRTGPSAPSTVPNSYTPTSPVSTCSIGHRTGVMSPESSTMTFSFRPGFTCVCPNTGPGPPSLSEWMTSQPGSAASTEAATTEVLPMPSMPSPGVMTCALTRMCGTVHSGVTATRSLTRTGPSAPSTVPNSYTPTSPVSTCSIGHSTCVGSPESSTVTP